MSISIDNKGESIVDDIRLQILLFVLLVFASIFFVFLIINFFRQYKQESKQKVNELKQKDQELNKELGELKQRREDSLRKLEEQAQLELDRFESQQASDFRNLESEAEKLQNELQTAKQREEQKAKIDLAEEEKKIKVVEQATASFDKKELGLVIKYDGTSVAYPGHFEFVKDVCYRALLELGIKWHDVSFNTTNKVNKNQLPGNVNYVIIVTFGCNESGSVYNMTLHIDAIDRNERVVYAEPRYIQIDMHNCGDSIIDPKTNQQIPVARLSEEVLDILSNCLVGIYLDQTGQQHKLSRLRRMSSKQSSN